MMLPLCLRTGLTALAVAGRGLNECVRPRFSARLPIAEISRASKTWIPVQVPETSYERSSSSLRRADIASLREGMKYQFVTLASPCHRDHQSRVRFNCSGIDAERLSEPTHVSVRGPAQGARLAHEGTWAAARSLANASTPGYKFSALCPIRPSGGTSFGGRLLQPRGSQYSG